MADLVTLGKLGMAIASYMSWEHGFLGLRNSIVESSDRHVPFFPKIYSMIGHAGSFGMAVFLCLPMVQYMHTVGDYSKLVMVVLSCIFWEIGLVSIKMNHFDAKKMRLSFFGQIGLMLFGLVAFAIAFALCYPLMEDLGLIEYIIQEVFE